jgi:hypothetical protein
VASINRSTSRPVRCLRSPLSFSLPPARRRTQNGTRQGSAILRACPVYPNFESVKTGITLD